MRILKGKIIPITLSIMVVLLITWGLTAEPDDSNEFRLKVNQTIFKFDFIRYDIKIRIWDKLNHLNKKHKIITINLYSPELMHKASKSVHEYITLKKLIIKLEKLPNIKVKAIASDIVISQSKEDLIKDLKELLHKKVQADDKTLHELSKLDKEFITTLRANPNIIMPIILTNTNVQDGILPKPLLHASDDSPIYDLPGYITNFPAIERSIKDVGFTTTSMNMDTVIRRTPLLIRHKSNIYPSLALAVALNLYDKGKIKINDVQFRSHRFLKSIQFDKHVTPVDKHGRVYIPFTRSYPKIKSYQAKDILQNKYNPQELDDAIIFITSEENAPSYSPERDIFSQISSAEAQASVLGSILSNKVLYEPYWSQTLTFLATFLVGIILITCFLTLGSSAAISILILLQVLLITLNLTLFLSKGLVLNLSAPIFVGLSLALINIMFGFIFESNRKRHIKKFFVQYVPPEYLDILLENPESYGFEGKSENLTVLFADIRNFTSISESLDANGVKKLLNELFTPMTRIILKHGGTVDKYVGDMIMAFFGAPIASENHRERALNCALEMLAKTRQMQRHFNAQGLPKIEITIGLNSGMMNVGDMGSEFRRSYTVIGDAVNLGSRIQDTTGYYGVKLIAGSNTCKDQDKFVFRMLDVVKLKGKSECETIYEVVGRRKSIRPYVLQEIEQHRRALAAYFNRDWDLAIELFTNLADNYPEFKTYTIFLERAKDYKQNPPSENWDGSYSFTEK